MEPRASGGGDGIAVVADIRRSTPTFRKRLRFEFSERNHATFWVPAGFAHGSLMLSEYADFLYRYTDFYLPTHEWAFLWNDREIGVKWPLAEDIAPILAAIDTAGARCYEVECASSARRQKGGRVKILYAKVLQLRVMLAGRHRRASGARCSGSSPLCTCSRVAMSVST